MNQSKELARAEYRLALGLAVLVGVAVSGCGRAEVLDAVADTQQQPAREVFPQPIELIPNDAELLLGLHPSLLAGSQLGAQLSRELAGEPQFQQAKQALDGCGLQPSRFESVLIGWRTDQFVIALVGSGFGEDAQAICMIEAAQRLVGAAPDATISVQDGKKIIDFPDGRVFLVNANLLVLSTAGWQRQVGELIDSADASGAKSAAKHDKRELLATIDTSAPAWLAAGLPPQLAMAANFMGVPEVAAATTISGALGLGERAQVELTAGFETATQAQTAAVELQGLLANDTASTDIPAALHAALGRVHVGNVGSRVRLDFEVQAGDFAALVAAEHALPPAR
ncbi:hypothetical protein DB30_03614 [Enhygromyxa salina]|uniref:Lipoprotein n=1 Tax=Enhygromyxa salina TaxID=215803 RepID=A0A0C2DAY3_9BACT|nr:hypothetical protein [Enhygromyxa salina]KIG17017.1 hypothetical protein DB30_03614 [Enhygromyxa salina]